MDQGKVVINYSSLLEKWEDGINEKVLGNPLANRDAKEIIKELIDAGADCDDLPAPGSRAGISVTMIRKPVEYIPQIYNQALWQ